MFLRNQRVSESPQKCQIYQANSQNKKMFNFSDQQNIPEEMQDSYFIYQAELVDKIYKDEVIDS